MEKLIWSPGAMLAPVPPALVTCGSEEKPNVMTVGWTGILNTKPPKTYISVRPERFSYNLLKETREFVINLPTVQLARSVDFCGVRSGKDIDKFAHCGLTLEKGSSVSVPSIAECPISIECRITDSVLLGTHEMFIADICAVKVSPDVVDENGKLEIQKCNLLAYAHGTYFSLGKQIGTFGFSVKKKKKKSYQNDKRNPKSQKKK